MKIYHAPADKNKYQAFSRKLTGAESSFFNQPKSKSQILNSLRGSSSFPFLIPPSFNFANSCMGSIVILGSQKEAKVNYCFAKGFKLH